MGNISMSPNKVKNIVEAIMLHNYLIQIDDLQSPDEKSTKESVSLDGLNRKQPAVIAQDPRGIKGDLNYFLILNKLQGGRMKKNGSFVVVLIYIHLFEFMVNLFCKVNQFEQKSFTFINSMVFQMFLL